MFAVNFVPNKFGRVRLELNGYQYMVKNNKGDRCYWKCIIPLCPATASTHYETITKSANYHTHVPNSARVKALLCIISAQVGFDKFTLSNMTMLFFWHLPGNVLFY
jgi:hypothetical protein